MQRRQREFLEARTQHGWAIQDVLSQVKPRLVLRALAGIGRAVRWPGCAHPSSSLLDAVRVRAAYVPEATQAVLAWCSSPGTERRAKLLLYSLDQCRAWEAETLRRQQAWSDEQRQWKDLFSAVESVAREAVLARRRKHLARQLAEDMAPAPSAVIGRARL